MASANAFEAGTRKNIPAVLVYARNRDRILMIHRNLGAHSGDYHAGKWNGLGGKCEPDESPLEAARREFGEEAGVLLPESSFRALGALTFPNFKAHKSEDWTVFVFRVELPDSLLPSVLRRNDEGELHWVPQGELSNLSLWAGDRHFIPLVAEGRPFVGTLWYAGQEVMRHWVQAL